MALGLKQELMDDIVEQISEEKKTAIKLEKMIEETVEETLEKVLAEQNNKKNNNNDDDTDVIETIIKHKSTISKKIKSAIAGIVMLGSTPYFVDTIFEQVENTIEITIKELKDLNVYLKKVHLSIKESTK